MSHSQPRVLALGSNIHTTCLSCDGHISPGDPVWWCPSVGAWHRDCPKPKSLNAVWTERKKQRELGL